MWDEIITRGGDWVRSGPGANRRFEIDVGADMVIMRFQAERDEKGKFGMTRAFSRHELNLSRDGGKSIIKYHFDKCVFDINNAVATEPLPAAQE